MAPGGSLPGAIPYFLRVRLYAVPDKV